MGKRVAVYCRVSTDGQTVQNQTRELHAVADRLGWEVVETITDEGISGTKGRDRRPGLDRLLKGVTRREFDIVAAWSVDRLGRSLQHLVELLGEINARGVDLYLHVQGIDTSTPAGRAMFQMLGVFAEFERSMITERIKAGLSRARAQGKQCGRPRVGPAKEKVIRDLLATGKGVVKVSREVGVGVGTVYKIKKAMMDLPPTATH